MEAIRKRFRVEVKEVHSGDDLVLLVDLGVDGLHKKVRARLFGVDVPSAYRASPKTPAGQIRDWVRDSLVNVECEIDLVSVGKGGWLVDLFVIGKDHSSVCLNEVLRAKGFVYNRNVEEK